MHDLCIGYEYWITKWRMARLKINERFQEKRIQ